MHSVSIYTIRTFGGVDALAQEAEVYNGDKEVCKWLSNLAIHGTYEEQEHLMYLLETEFSGKTPTWQDIETWIRKTRALFIGY